MCIFYTNVSGRFSSEIDMIKLKTNHYLKEYKQGHIDVSNFNKVPSNN